MKYLNASLLLFFLVSTIDAEKKNLTSDESSLYEYDENSEKNSEKRWLGENQPKAVLAEPSPFVPVIIYKSPLL